MLVLGVSVRVSESAGVSARVQGLVFVLVLGVRCC